MGGQVADAVRAGSFTPQESRVARALLADYPRAGLGKVHTLAEAAGVSAPTVVRFARTLGFSGFAQLQEALLAEIAERHASPITQLDARAGRGEDWFDDGLTMLQGEVGRSLRAIPRAEIDAAVSLLSDRSRRITAIGGRYTRLLADYLTLHLQQVRPHVRARSEQLSIGISDVIDAGRKDVFVIYDVRRYQQLTVTLAEQLAETGAQLICITDEWLSPVALQAQVVLPVSVRAPGPFDSAAAAFMLTELLIDAVLTEIGPSADARMRRWDDASSHEVL